MKVKWENRKQYFQEYRKNNRQRILENQRKWYKKNRLKVLQSNKEWRKKNRKKWNEIVKNWAKKNKDKVYSYSCGFDRKTIFKRDHYQCQNCGSKENLEIHHIDGKGMRIKKKERNNLPQNLITLCSKCHYKTDRNRRGMPYKNKKLKEWAKNFDKCIYCGTIKRKHIAKGLCNRCYELKRKEYKTKYYQKHYGVLTRVLASAIFK